MRLADEDPAALLVSSSVAEEDDQNLFRGGVPQVADWLRAWRSAHTPVSYEGAAAQNCTENFIQSSRKPGTPAKAFRAMIRIICLVLRRLDDRLWRVPFPVWLLVVGWAHFAVLLARQIFQGFLKSVSLIIPQGFKDAPWDLTPPRLPNPLSDWS